MIKDHSGKLRDFSVFLIEFLSGIPLYQTPKGSLGTKNIILWFLLVLIADQTKNHTPTKQHRWSSSKYKCCSKSPFWLETVVGGISYFSKICSTKPGWINKQGSYSPRLFLFSKAFSKGKCWCDFESVAVAGNLDS